jgi:hypothetical protein
MPLGREDVLHSQNGWPVLDRDDLHWFTAAGQRFAAANADAATIAAYLIERFNAEVEPIHGTVMDDWSYAVRNVRGSATFVSNHASASAWDLNATRHPRGVHGTFSKAELRAIQRILADITDDSGDRVVRFGGDFTTVVDSMHFEINAGPRSVHQAAEKIRALEDDVQQKDIDAIVKALRPIIRAEVTAGILATEISLGTFASSVLVDRDGKPTKTQSVGNLLQWAAAHAQNADATATEISQAVIRP